MYELQLSEWLAECPPEWRNFSEFIAREEKHDPDDSGWSVELIDSYLAEYNARFFDDPDSFIGPYVLFNSDVDIVAFKLRFG